MLLRSRGRGPPIAGAASWYSLTPGWPGTPSAAFSSLVAVTAKVLIRPMRYHAEQLLGYIIVREAIGWGAVRVLDSEFHQYVLDGILTGADICHYLQQMPLDIEVHDLGCIVWYHNTLDTTKSNVVAPSWK